MVLVARMPLKNLTSDNENSFIIGRKIFIKTFNNISENNKTKEQEKNLKNLKPQPLKNNSADLYINRKKNNAIGKGSYSNLFSFNTVIKTDLNTINNSRNLVRN